MSTASPPAHTSAESAKKRRSRKSPLRRVLTVLVAIAAIIALLIAAVVITRMINLSRFPESGDATMSDPTNLSVYPTDIPGVSIEHVTGEYLNGFHLKPEDQTSRGTIVTFGGSEGSPDFAKARRLAEAGYDTYALFFFGMPNQQPMLSRVPLESFEEVINQVAATNDGGPLTVIGTSKGAEYAANVATRYSDDVDNLVLIAPSAYSFPGLGQEQNASSWTWQGKDVEMISFQGAGFGPTATMLAQLMLAFPVAYEPVYTAAVAGAENPEAARIPIEDFDGNILAIAGGSDRMWASAEYAELIAARHPDTELSIHPEAGHVFGAPPKLRAGQMVIDSGGSQAANEKALEDANQDLSRVLQEWHEHS